MLILYIFSETGHDPAVHGARLEDRYYNNDSFKVKVIQIDRYYNTGMRKFRIDQDFLIEYWHMMYVMSVVFAEIYV